MARLSNMSYPGDWEFAEGTDINEYFKKQDAQYAAIIAAQPAPDSPSLVNALLSFPRGDGYALYVVVKDKPLTLAHVPMGDAWDVDECTLRGVTATYVRKSLVRAAALRKLFTKKGENK
jgi:hypothetical protein